MQNHVTGYIACPHRSGRLLSAPPAALFRPGRFGPLTVVSLMLLSALAVLPVAAPAARAASSLVQQNDGGCNNCLLAASSFDLGFNSPVTSGDMVVVAFDLDFSPTVILVFGGSGQTYTQAVSSNTNQAHAYLYYATLTAGGPYSVGVSYAGAPPGSGYEINIYEISGVTASTMAAGSGSGFTGLQNSLFNATASSTAFSPGAFLVGSIAFSNGFSTYAAAGPRFALSNSAAGEGYTEYSASGVSSPTTFPITICPSAGEATLPCAGGGGPFYWAIAAIALNPKTTSSTSVACSPSPISLGFHAVCTATIAGTSPAGMITWFTSGTGTFSSGTCALSSGSCSVTYTPTASGSPVTVTASYPGDSSNAAGSGTFSLTVNAGFVLPSIPPGAAPAVLTMRTYGGTTLTGYRVAFVGGAEVEYNVPGWNGPLFYQELLAGNPAAWNFFPIPITDCIDGNGNVRTSGFFMSWWGGPLNSTEIIFGDYQSFVSSSVGWPPLPACSG